MAIVQSSAALVVGSWISLCALSAVGHDTLIVVQLLTGREFQGNLDPGSDKQQLVLRTSRGGVTLRRPIAWERIAAATVDGKAVDVAMLKQLVQQSGIARASSKEVGGQRPNISGQPSKARRIDLRDIGSAQAAPSESATEPRPQITSIAFDAFLSNWDGDVESDGLVIELEPVDKAGHVVAASGTVEVELFAPQRRSFHHAPLSGGDTLELVQRWSQTVVADDFGPWGVRLRLPFGAVHPEIDSDWLASSYGLVHVRMAIAGHGVFEASRDGVRIRPWSPNRDRSEMNTGRRFLSAERLGRPE